MTSVEFIDKVNLAKLQAANLAEGNAGYNIHRGMAHSISGYTEDLFAVFIAQVFNNKLLTFWVDKVISCNIEPGKKAKSFKPDLMIVDNKKVTHYYDVKTDMGWNRDFTAYLEKKHRFIDSIKGKNTWITSKGIRDYVTIPPNIKYRMVIVYGWNINQMLLKKNIEFAKKLGNVDVYVLYSKDKEDEPFSINEKEFERLIADARTS